MYLQIGEVVLWNNAEAMRKNGNCPGEVALTLCQDFGVQLDDLRKPKRQPTPGLITRKSSKFRQAHGPLRLALNP